jgi:arylsulfatase A
MMGARVVIGGKGSTTDAGMHVPLIASGPGLVKAGTVCGDLVDSTDFLPTLLDAAGLVPPQDLKLDGRSFLPQLRGEKGNPREWVYSWYSPRQNNDRKVKELAFDARYKLYRDGTFFDLERDPEEKKPLDVARLEGEAVAAAQRLRGALDRFKDARPAELDGKAGGPDEEKPRKRKPKE